MQDVTAAWRRLAVPHERRDAGEVARPLAGVIRAGGLRAIGIAGAPGAGKSTIAHAVADELRASGDDPLVISLDDYYLSKQERASRGLAQRGPPGSHDVDALLEALDMIASGTGPVTVQRFSAATDDRIDPVTIAAPPSHVLLEGWVLGHRGDGYGAILDRMDVLVFIDVGERTARRRRFEREAALRDHGGGFSEEGMNRFWDEVLAPGMSRWVADARATADLVLELRDDGGLRSAHTSSAVLLAALDVPPTTGR